MNSIIVAHDLNRVIGNEGQIPWRGELPADMKHFRNLTIGNTVLMGRTTFNSIGRPLPDRKNIVFTRDEQLSIEGVEIVHSIDEALEAEVIGDTLFIAGGAKVYELFMPITDRLYVTKIEAEFSGDTFFVQIDPADWHLTANETNMPSGKNKYIYTFQTYERK